MNAYDWNFNPWNSSPWSSSAYMPIEDIREAMRRATESGSTKPRASDSATSTLPPPVDRSIDECLQPREAKREIAMPNQEVLAAYQGAILPAEADSKYRLESNSRLAVEKEKYRSVGRRIDLASMLNQQRPDGNPRWAIVDPRYSIGTGGATSHVNGLRRYGCLYVGGVHVSVKGITAHQDFLPVGFPPLPEPVRDLFTSEKHAELRQATKWMGVLYQPEEWALIKPDPAVICEYKAIPDEYFCLMLWGGDKANIEEWID